MQNHAQIRVTNLAKELAYFRQKLIISTYMCIWSQRDGVWMAMPDVSLLICCTYTWKSQRQLIVNKKIHPEVGFSIDLCPKALKSQPEKWQQLYCVGCWESGLLLPGGWRHLSDSVTYPPVQSWKCLQVWTANFPRLGPLSSGCSLPVVNAGEKIFACMPLQQLSVVPRTCLGLVGGDTAGGRQATSNS